MTRSDEIRRRCHALAAEQGTAWYEQAVAVLTEAESASVTVLWGDMPGSCCWRDAFRCWLALMSETEQKAGSTPREG